jgi:hypothetical protein
MLDGGSKTLRTSRGLRALGLFAAVWLNLALSPCVMAYQAVDQHDCPDCPTSAMIGHHGMQDGKADQAPCADDLADCMIDDEISHDGRAGQLKIDDAPDTGLVFYAGEPDSLDFRICPGALPRYAASRPGAPPPIYLINCVFLD